MPIHHFDYFEEIVEKVDTTNDYFLLGDINVDLTPGVKSVNGTKLNINIFWTKSTYCRSYQNYTIFLYPNWIFVLQMLLKDQKFWDNRTFYK